MKALAEREAIVVGGGNTFQLLRTLYRTNLLRAIAERAKRGMPYLGWSAGSNVACPTIMTTNDMPIAEPPSLARHAPGALPDQSALHGCELVQGHGGESRDQRIAEFLAAEPAGAWSRLARRDALLHVQEDAHDTGRQWHARFPQRDASRWKSRDGSALRMDLRDVDQYAPVRRGRPAERAGKFAHDRRR